MRKIIFILAALALGFVVALSCEADQTASPQAALIPIQTQATVLVPQPPLAFSYTPIPGTRPVFMFVGGKPYVVYVPTKKARIGGIRGMLLGDVYRN